MSPLKRALARVRQGFTSENVFMGVLIILGAVFFGLGVYGFRLRHQRTGNPFGWLNALGCLLGTGIAGFVLLVSDYVFHHAPLVFIPFVLVLFVAGVGEPHFGIGMGLALWCVAAWTIKELVREPSRPGAPPPQEP